MLISSLLLGTNLPLLCGDYGNKHGEGLTGKTKFYPNKKRILRVKEKQNAITKVESIRVSVRGK